MYTPENFTVLARDNYKFLPGSWLTCPRKVQFTREKIPHDMYPKIIDSMRSTITNAVHEEVIKAIGGKEIQVLTACADPLIEYAYYTAGKGPILAKLVTTPGLAARIFIGSFVPRDDLLYAGLISRHIDKPVNLHYISISAYTDVPLPAYKSISVTVDKNGYIEKNFANTGEQVAHIWLAATILDAYKDNIATRPENREAICRSCPYHKKCVVIDRMVIPTLKILKTMGDRT
jgi:hypothetical protein